MSKQGYLIKHDRKEGSSVVYIVLLEGELKYYDKPNGSLLGGMKLSGNKVNVKAQRRSDGIPNSFFIETRQVRIKDRSYTLGSKVMLELSATTSEERQAWGSTIFSWQQYYWRDLEEESDQLEMKNAQDSKMLRAILSKYTSRSSRAPVLMRKMSDSFRRHSSKQSTTSSSTEKASGEDQENKKEIPSRVTISLPQMTQPLQPVS